MGKLKIGTKCTGTNNCIIFHECKVDIVGNKISLPSKIDIGGGVEQRQM